VEPDATDRTDALDDVSPNIDNDVTGNIHESGNSWNIPSQKNRIINHHDGIPNIGGSGNDDKDTTSETEAKGRNTADVTSPPEITSTTNVIVMWLKNRNKLQIHWHH
jgi:hypothetical protein